METDVWVIGTNPPCPRCALVGKRVQNGMKTNGISGTCRHSGYDAPAAQQFARSLGFQIGTAKDVARTYGLDMDWEAVTRIIGRRIQTVSHQKGCKPQEVELAEQWTPDLDEALRPCQETARNNGFLMTPVLVVDGVIKWHGSVPSEQWIADEAFNR